MWSVEYVQVPDETKIVIPDKPEPNGTSLTTTDMCSNKGNEFSKGDNADETVYQRSRSMSCDSYEEDSQRVVNRLQEFKDPDQLTSKYVEPGSSVDSNSHFMSKMLERLEGAGKSGRDSQGAIQSEVGMGNLSATSSISDLCVGEEIVDGEVQSVLSMASAVEATEDMSQSDITDIHDDLVSLIE